ncbi:hypothetical protein PR002_g8232 [Phytophthora rubi]|uniref:Secreted protein n=1 Tax=Phytophthora rubi TaxID=129364 RepID=A0A6A3MY13_9STRA|nr:hypothetical protein PR002_g8230 [Phytophthora rubi]KAE9034265.1 hypothetical protein PR002_g8232 [Phytophthora rubi]
MHFKFESFFSFHLFLTNIFFTCAFANTNIDHSILLPILHRPAYISSSNSRAASRRPLRSVKQDAPRCSFGYQRHLQCVQHAATLCSFGHQCRQAEVLMSPMSVAAEIISRLHFLFTCFVSSPHRK